MGVAGVVQNIIDRGVGFCLWAAMCMGGVPGWREGKNRNLFLTFLESDLSKLTGKITQGYMLLLWQGEAFS